MDRVAQEVRGAEPQQPCAECRWSVEQGHSCDHEHRAQYGRDCFQVVDAVCRCCDRLPACVLCRELCARHRKAGEPQPPAEVWPPCHFIREECKSRGWTEISFAAALDDTAFAFDLWHGGRALNDVDCNALAAVFGASAEYWRALDAAWWASLERELNSGAEPQPATPAEGSK